MGLALVTLILSANGKEALARNQLTSDFAIMSLQARPFGFQYMVHTTARHGYDSESNHESTQNRMLFA